MLPDIDLLLGIFDIQHRTITHSVIFWSLAFVPFFIKYRRVAVPYLMAVSQHILLGDLVVGRTAVFWPIIDLRVGLGLSLLSPISLALEAAGLAILFSLAFKYRDPAKRSLFLQILVLVPLSSFVILASVGDVLPTIFLEGSDARHLERNLPALLLNPNLQVAVILHLGLIAIVGFPFHKFHRANNGSRIQKVHES